MYLSYLFSRDPRRSVAGSLLDAAFKQYLVLQVPVGVLVELNTVVRNPHSNRRVSQQQVELFLRQLSIIGITLPREEGAPPRICRDPNDDFLIAAALGNGTDFLVTLDRDLLELERVLALRIVDPTSFLNELSQQTT